jgi:hypothetical protein
MGDVVVSDRKKKAEDYEVGHGKPPSHSRFKKGQSGNPAGRRKKKEPEPADASTDGDIFTRKMEVTIDGKRMRVPPREVLLAQILQEGLGGDKQSRREFIKLEEREAKRPKAEPLCAPPVVRPPTIIHRDTITATARMLHMILDPDEAQTCFKMHMVESALRTMTQDQLRGLDMEKLSHFVEDKDAFLALHAELLEPPSGE